MNLKRAILSIVAFSSISLHAGAAVVTFQQGVDGYDGFEQVNLYGDHSQTQNHSGSQVLWAWGTATAGWKQSFLIRFDDVFDPLNGGLPEDVIVTSARIELYKVRQLGYTVPADVYVWDNTDAAQQQVRMYEWLTPVNNGGPAGYATYTYKNYIDADNNTPWLNVDGTPSTEGPKSSVDWRFPPRLGTIQMEIEAPNQWYSLDVTDVVNTNRELNGTAGAGFYFTAATSWLGLDFASGTYSNTEYRPRLVLEYAVIPEPKSVILMGLAAFILLVFGRRKAKTA